MTSQNPALQQAILDSANYSIISTTVDGIITTFNQTAERWLGYRAAEVVNKTTPILIHDCQEVEQRSQELSQELGVTIEPGFETFVAKARRGEADEYEWTYIRKDSSRFPVRLSITALKDKQGEITGFLGIGSDITEQKRIKTERLELIERERIARGRTEQILESITDAFFAIDNHWCFTYINRQAELLLQRERSELLGQNVWQKFPEAVGSNFEREYQRAIAEQVSVEFEEFYPPLDTWFTVHAYPYENGLSVYFQDISERKTPELERIKNEQQLRQQQAALVELAKNQVLYHSNLPVAIQAVVEKAAQTLEVEWVGVWFYQHDRSFIYAVDRYQLSQQSHSSGLQLLAENYPTYFQTLETEEILVADDAQNDLRTKEFGSTWLIPQNICSMMDVPIRSGGKTVGVICHEHVGSIRHWTIEEQNFASSLAHTISLAIEVRDRATVEAQLRESESSFHGAFDYAAIGMAIVSLDGNWLQVNHSLCEMIGYSESELLATTFQKITHPEDLEIDLSYVHQMLTGEIPYYHLEKRYLHKQGSIVWIMLSVSLVRDSQDNPLYFIAQIQDISERKQAESALLQHSAALQNFSINLKHLHRINTTEYQDFEALFADCLATGCEIFGLSTGIVSHVKDNNYTIQAVQSDLALEAEAEFNLDDTYCTSVVKERNTIAYAHVGELATMRTHPVYQNLKLESYIGTPIWVKGKIYGTLNFSDTKVRPEFQPQERELIELMAQSIGRFITAWQTETERQQ
ncbi:MAG: PAS domain S-box protein, partial [Cyanobacteria bacterium P01_A01_bin.40]